MKTTAALYLAAFATILLFTACTLTDQRAKQLSAIAAKSLEVATAFGYIEPEEAAKVEAHGALVLSAFKTDSVSQKVVAISAAAVAAAAAHGEITPAQAAAAGSQRLANRRP